MATLTAEKPQEESKVTIARNKNLDLAIQQIAKDFGDGAIMRLGVGRRFLGGQMGGRLRVGRGRCFGRGFGRGVVLGKVGFHGLKIRRQDNGHAMANARKKAGAAPFAKKNRRAAKVFLSPRRAAHIASRPYGHTHR